MAAINYARTATKVAGVIRNNGRDMTFIKVDTTPADAAKPHRGGGVTPTSVGPVKGLESRLKEADLGEEGVSRGDKRILVSALDAGGNDLLTFNKVEDGATVWRIVGGKRTKPGDTELVYTLFVRR